MHHLDHLLPIAGCTFPENVYMTCSIRAGCRLSARSGTEAMARPRIYLPWLKLSDKATGFGISLARYSARSVCGSSAAPSAPPPSLDTNDAKCHGRGFSSETRSNKGPCGSDL